MGAGGSYEILKTCGSCGRQWRASKHAAKYCGAKCRKAAQRDREGLKKSERAAIASLQFLRGYFHDKDSRVDMQARGAMREIRNLIDSWLLE